VFARLPNTRVHLVAQRLDPIETDRGLTILATSTYATCPQLDVIVVPGGPGQQDLMDDEPTLEFLRQQAEGAAYIASVCTGSLVLGAAALLKGRRATSHWGAVDLLAYLGRFRHASAWLWTAIA
jgi:cyclohexyl-isocyanide hydratase